MSSGIHKLVTCNLHGQFFLFLCFFKASEGTLKHVTCNPWLVLCVPFHLVPLNVTAEDKCTLTHHEINTSIVARKIMTKTSISFLYRIKK